MNKIKVGFDISQLAHRGGVATYTQNLAANLEKEEELEMTYFYSSLRKPYVGGLNNVKRYRMPPTLFEVLFNRARIFPIDKLIGKVDIFHSSDWIQPKTAAKKITTYHDLIPLKFPEWSLPRIVDTHRRRLKIVEREIDGVITVSKSAKKDLLEVSGIAEGKIKVIYEGVEDLFSPRSDEAVNDFRKKYNLPDDFVLAIGGIGERRNLNRIKEAARGYNLVVTGESVYVQKEEMPVLYSAAKVLLYPSLYEGFGLPIVEAFACGCPVVTSNVSSMPEISEGAAIEVDPLNVDKIANALKNVMGDEDLREGMIEKGFRRARFFSWPKAADETTEFYKEVLRG